VAAVTGSANIVTAVTCRDRTELFSYVTGQLGGLPGVIHVEVVPVLSRLKQAATRVAGDRLVQACGSGFPRNVSRQAPTAGRTWRPASPPQQDGPKTVNAVPWTNSASLVT